jgi:hypothetical protein
VVVQHYAYQPYYFLYVQAKTLALQQKGCFAGLISIVAEDIPELKELYALHTYSFSDWANALQDFLGIGLEMWAWENHPKHYFYLFIFS